MDMKLSSSRPVTDIDRAKAFYVDQVGFVADHDIPVDETCGSCSHPPGRPARSCST